MNLNRRLQNDDTINIVNSVVDFFKLNTILDVGCGDGHYHRWIKGRVVGVDKAYSSTNIVKHDICVFPYPIPDTWPKEYDLVMMLDVLEHLVYPEDVLLNLRSYVSPKGFLFISVPNIDCIDDIITRVPISVYDPALSDVTGGRWCKDHLRFFNLVALEKLVTSCGYEVSYITGSNVLASRVCEVIVRRLADAFSLDVAAVARVLGESLPYHSPNISLLAKKK